MFKKNFFFRLIFFLAALGLCCCERAFSSCVEQGLLFLAVCGPLIAVASLAVEHRLRVSGLQPLQQEAQSLLRTDFIFSTACGVLPDQGASLCSLHWQADSFPLYHQGSPKNQYILIPGSLSCG